MKRKGLISLLLCLAFALSACTSPSPTEAPSDTTPTETPSTPTENASKSDLVDFSDGNTAFLLVNKGSPDTDADSSIDIVELDGANVLKLSAPNNGSFRMGVGVDGLLGQSVTNVKTIEFEVLTENANEFFVASGAVTAISGDTVTDSNSWTSVMDDSLEFTPYSAVLSGDGLFTGSAANAVEFAVLSNQGHPAAIYIKSIKFIDSDNKPIPVDTSAGWTGPDTYGASSGLVTLDVLEEYGVDLVDDKPSQLRFPIADRISEFSIFKITYKSGAGNLPAIIFMSPPNYWYQFQIAKGDKYFTFDKDPEDDEKAVDDIYHVEISSAELQSDATSTKYANDSMCAFKGVPCAVQDGIADPCCAATTDALSVVFSNWDDDIEILSFVIENALPK
jgi:hypothetical protein